MASSSASPRPDARWASRHGRSTGTGRTAHRKPPQDGRRRDADPNGRHPRPAGGRRHRPPPRRADQATLAAQDTLGRSGAVDATLLLRPLGQRPRGGRRERHLSPTPRRRPSQPAKGAILMAGLGPCRWPSEWAPGCEAVSLALDPITQAGATSLVSSKVPSVPRSEAHADVRHHDGRAAGHRCVHAHQRRAGRRAFAGVAAADVRAQARGRLRYIEVWESEEQAARAQAERIYPVVSAAFGGPPPPAEIRRLDLVEVR